MRKIKDILGEVFDSIIDRLLPVMVIFVFLFLYLPFMILTHPYRVWKYHGAPPNCCGSGCVKCPWGNTKLRSERKKLLATLADEAQRGVKPRDHCYSTEKGFVICDNLDLRSGEPDEKNKRYTRRGI
jgi:hypothetical protein